MLCNSFRRTLRTPLLVAVAAMALGALMPATAAAETITFGYDRNGRLVSAAYGNGVTISYEYDASGNILRRRIQTAQFRDGPAQSKLEGRAAPLRRRVI